MTLSLPLVLVVDVLLVAVTYAFAKGWLQRVLAWAKTSKAAVATVVADTKAEVTKVEDQVQK